MKATTVAGIMLAVVSTGCGNSQTTTTAPSTASTTTTSAAPTTTENFSGILPVKGSSFYSFSVGQDGTVNVMLVSIGGAEVPSSVFVGLGIGTPSGTSCSVAAPSTVQAGSTAQVTATETAGMYCVNISDVGNLFAPATFNITIAHP